MAARSSIPPAWARCARIAAVQCGSACARRGRRARPGSSAVRVGRETKGRAGKGVTTVTGLPLSPADIEALAGAAQEALRLREGRCATASIEIQGDHRDTLVAALVKLGWPAKKSGG